jgi:hypothetical protein
MAKKKRVHKRRQSYSKRHKTRYGECLAKDMRGKCRGKRGAAAKACNKQKMKHAHKKCMPILCKRY